MPSEFTTLRIKAERLGSIGEITGLLNAIETAYNSLYAFDIIVNGLNEQVRRDLDYLLRKEILTRDLLKSSNYSELGKEYQRLYDLMDIFYMDGSRLRPRLTSFYAELDLRSIVSPSDRLVLSKVNIQSPGFWEFLGAQSPLAQLREYLKERHERNKDRSWRDDQARRKGELDIIEQKNNLLNKNIDTLKKLGYDDIQIRQMVDKMVHEPLLGLAGYQDNGQIEGTEDGN